MTSCTGNSVLPPTPDSPPQRQSVHSDADFAHHDHPCAFVVNVPPIDLIPQSRSTEVWLGTQQAFGLDAQEGAHGERNSGQIRISLPELKSRKRHPVQPGIPKASSSVT
ncbi:hypothetical protein A1O1_03297 [Capronia coronata CBS 617.96]|uniref:Uncharacterized protein n=1 Tax=Capronia coronata CBS 617.96 TaxID=1182541 RepID=W9YCE1_9EURO|nr:uncharacterized protein A1O1_03297 [Capronia coronata CBS 617.96]EXJ90198.1 hypothetical protein A1O1_03297 [Capronia coronata CBS 617.96]